MMIIPELLSPAGDRERLEAAVMYGADAVYLGSTSLGMRAAPQNFDAEQLKSAVELCHGKGKKVYLTCNVLAHNSDLLALPSIIESAVEAGIDAMIISDMGVLSLVKKLAPQMEIHISTQTGLVNHAAAQAMYDMGAKRVVLARELSLEEIAEIRAKTPSDLEIECFVHGAMCVSFSGRCLLSNYFLGRDSNRGECAQPCRWKYAIMEEKRPGFYLPIGEDHSGTYIMNARDMCMIEHIPEMVKAGISSFKIEGRAKSSYYTAVITNAYRAAIDGYIKNPTDDYKPEQWMIDETRKVSHREYCTGFFFSDPKDDAQIYYDGVYKRNWNVMAEVNSCENGRMYVTQRNRFFEGDELEIMVAGAEPITVKVENLQNEKGEPIDVAPHPMMKCSFSCDADIHPGALIRKAEEE
ncbi:MAG: U32 family peptidase [Clostridia bacterium]|nr:U32 family peptidase [Clostridia bacterium]